MSDLMRRTFLKGSAAALAGAGLASHVLADQEDGPAGIPTRPLGRTGERVSIVGLGGYHIGLPPEDEAIAIMHEAIDAGMTFFDNSWDYHAGGSEERMGKALAESSRRDRVFLMTKCCARDARTAREHLEDSLRRMKTDRIDLWQFHEVNWLVDADWICDRGGALETALKAREEGKVRYIGFTGHKDPRFLSRMLQRVAGGDFDWDTAQMPINPLDPHYRSFRDEVVPECNRRQIGVVGMKALAGGRLPAQLGISAEDCRRYALSQPICTLCCGIASRKDLLQDLAIARGFKPMTEAEQNALLAKTQEPGADGRHEVFKTTRYGSEYHFRQHGEGRDQQRL